MERGGNRCSIVIIIIIERKIKPRTERYRENERTADKYIHKRYVGVVDPERTEKKR